MRLPLIGKRRRSCPGGSVEVSMSTEHRAEASGWPEW